MFNLAYQQLSELFEKLAAVKTVPLPAKGWVRAIRDGLGDCLRIESLLRRTSWKISADLAS